MEMGWTISILWKFSLNIAYIFEIAFLTKFLKFWHFDQRFSRNIITPLYLKFEQHINNAMKNWKCSTKRLKIFAVVYVVYKVI